MVTILHLYFFWAITAGALNALAATAAAAPTPAFLRKSRLFIMYPSFFWFDLCKQGGFRRFTFWSLRISPKESYFQYGTSSHTTLERSPSRL